MINLEVAIIGNGISALTAANFLHKKGITQIAIFANDNLDFTSQYPTITLNPITDKLELTNSLIETQSKKFNKNNISYILDSSMIIDYKNHIITTKDNKFSAKKIIIAKPKENLFLELKNAKNFESNTLFYNFNDAIKYAIKENLIIYTPDKSHIIDILSYAKLFKKINLIIPKHINFPKDLPKNIKLYIDYNPISIMTKNNEIRGLFLRKETFKNSVRARKILILPEYKNPITNLSKDLENIFVCGESKIIEDSNLIDYIIDTKKCCEKIQ